MIPHLFSFLLCARASYHAPTLYMGVILGGEGVLQSLTIAIVFDVIYNTNGHFYGTKLCNQVRSLDHFVVQNSGDFLC